MPKETLKSLKETNEGGKVKMRKMFKNKKRNHANIRLNGFPRGGKLTALGPHMRDFLKENYSFDN